MSMVERVGEALALADSEDYVGGPFVWNREHYIPLARAAIEAMMEPTDEMVEAGENDGGHSIYRWQSMITAALKEG